MNRKCIDCEIEHQLNGKNFPYLQKDKTFSNRCKSCHNTYIDKYLQEQKAHKQRLRDNKVKFIMNHKQEPTSKKRHEYNKKKKSSTIRGISFLLTEGEFNRLKEEEKCFYCNAQTTKRTDVYCPSEQTIDRINNDVCYIDGNCVSSCHWCNTIKSQSDLDEFIKRLINKQTEVQKELDALNQKIPNIIENIESYKNKLM